MKDFLRVREKNLSGLIVQTASGNLCIRARRGFAVLRMRMIHISGKDRSK